MKIAIIIFPGTNRERDARDALLQAGVDGGDIDFIWHKDRQFHTKPDIIIIPGGFSWGDYLRSGAISAHSVIMREIIQLANQDHQLCILGICNGFQILSEAGLLPGALMRNRSLNFISKPVTLKIMQTKNRVTQKYQLNQIVTYPVAHHDGNYFADAEVLQQLEANKQILFRYCDAVGEINDIANINGSVHNIAGICNEKGNVIGLMPHPENAIRNYHASQDGSLLFSGLFSGLAYE